MLNFIIFIENLIMCMKCLTSKQNKIFANHIIGILKIKDILKTLFMMRKQQKSLHWLISHQNNQILHKKLRKIYLGSWFEQLQSTTAEKA